MSLEDTYAAEQAKLERVIEHIRAEQIRAENRLQTHAADRSARAALRDALQPEQATLEASLKQPYFGRIDYVRTDSKREAESQEHIVYIGAHHIDNTNVYSWTAPVARMWYTEDSGYGAPSGYIRVRLDLKRFLRIRGEKVVEINDRFRRLLPASDRDLESPLIEVLDEAGRDVDKLQVIVETIEPHQYEAIANQEDRTLIVQGSAGSGKSEIGLHRIAYLLSPFNDIDERDRPRPETTLFIGPSQSFLEYAGDVLPTLGVQRTVRQVTFADWRQDLRTFRIRISPSIWNELLSRGRLRRFDEKLERFKGSLAMSDALDRWVRGLMTKVGRDCRNLSTRIQLEPRRRVIIAPEQIRATLKTTLSAPPEEFRLNDRRQAFVRTIASMILASANAGRRVSRDESERQRRATERQVSEWCAESWPRFDARREYVALLRDSELLLTVAQGDLSEDDVQALAESTERMLSAGFQDSDEGALTYLDHLFNGTIERRYRHIVVDEAQDSSPIEFKLLSLASINNWFTILGDTAQRLTPYRGIHRWRSLDRILGRSDIRVQHARISYRSNKHITRFNNRILRLFESNLLAPIPFNREGSRVEFHRHTNVREMQQSVVEDIDRIRSEPRMSGARIAILARDNMNLKKFEVYCQVLGRDDVARIGQDHYVDSRTVLARIPDVRGLEYDAVIVLGVNDAFADTLFNQKLLYQATTRARHYLAIHWAGKISPILSSVSDRGVRKIDRRRR
ncbi:MAG: UvrD-helicase domain-containing protein [Chloroflexota bacterium]|nr:UvrD-helicase domain-containing protein [Chloroflexota bacterium]